MNAQPCPACHASQSRMFVEEPKDREYFVTRGVPASVLRCDGCEGLFQSPWPTARETASFYKENYQMYRGSRIPLLSLIYDWQQKRTSRSFIAQYGADVSVLDFGCGQGAFLLGLERMGCRNLAGFDFSPRVESAAPTQAQFFHSLEAIRNSGRRFGIIRMNHVIEHLADLDETMSLLASLLEEGGRIIGQTPNAAHYTSRWMGQFWGPLHYPYHTVLFSPAGLRAASGRWGLEVAGTAPSPMPTGWAMSAENWIKSLFRSRREGRLAIYSGLMAASVPMVLWDCFGPARESAVFDFVLTRR
jgi:SAM-dependent methyltransferase